MLSGAIGLGAATGPFVSTAFIKTGDEGRRWAFWLPAILASLTLIPIWPLVPQKPLTGNWRDKVKKIDVFGLSSAVIGILFYIVEARSDICADSCQLRREYLALAQSAHDLLTHHRINPCSRVRFH